jgi:hypothetical protein
VTSRKDCIATNFTNVSSVTSRISALYNISEKAKLLSLFISHFRREVFYNILFEFWVLVKLVRLIKMCFLHEISNDNGVRVVNLATSKNLIVKSTMFPHLNIHKFTWTSTDGNTTKLTIF